MKSITKCAALITAAAVAGSLTSCGSTSYALAADNYDVRAGVFIFYTMSAYDEAARIISEAGDDSTDAKVVKNAHVDGITSSEWIQNKAAEYCAEFVAVEREFEKIGGELTPDEEDEINQTMVYYIGNYKDYGVGEQSLTDIIASTYKRQHIFEYYYGFDAEKGASEDELKDYFDDHFARVKYIQIDFKDADGNMVKGTEKDNLVKMAEGYIDRINSVSANAESGMGRLYEMNKCMEDYNVYLDELEKQAADYVPPEGEEEPAVTTATTSVVITTTTTTDESGNADDEAAGTTPAADEAETETTTTTTTSAAEPGDTETETTTNPFDNEALIERATEPATSGEPDLEGTTTTEVTYTPSKASNRFIFEIEKSDYNKAFYFAEAECCYVIMRADLRVRMTEDDLWSKSVTSYFQNELFNDEFSDYMKGIGMAYEIKRNYSAFKRYEPFKLGFMNAK